MMRHKGTVPLETERLILRRFTLEDAPDMYANWASDSEVTKYLTWPTHLNADMSRRFLGWCVDQYEKPDYYCWGIEDKATHRLIGNIAAVECDEDVDAVALGWVLGRAWWGQGIMPEAARAAARFFFDEVGVNRIWSYHDAENQKSGRVMQKLGMRYEGRQRACKRNNHGIADIDFYGLLKSDAAAQE